MKNRLMGFIVGFIVALSVSAYATGWSEYKLKRLMEDAVSAYVKDWSDYPLKRLIREVVEQRCKVDERGNIAC